MMINSPRYGALCAMFGCGIVTLLLVGWAHAILVMFFGWLMACVIDGLLSLVSLAIQRGRNAAHDDS